jgi:small subunit ribosomal protein S4
MLFKKKNRFIPYYKTFVKTGENIKDSRKILKFKKQKWNFLLNLLSRKLRFFKKYKPKNQLQYFVSRNPTKWHEFREGRYRNMLIVFRRFLLFYGYLTKKKMRVYIKQAIKSSKKTSINSSFLKTLESRLDVVLYRTKFCKSIKTARQIITHKGVLVNNKQINIHSYILKNGDLVTIQKKYHKKTERHIAVSPIWPIPPKHLIINYKTFQFIFSKIDKNTYSTDFNFNLNLEKLLVDYFYHKV